jgi:hypothetical protein
MSKLNDRNADAPLRMLAEVPGDDALGRAPAERASSERASSETAAAV